MKGTATLARSATVALAAVILGISAWAWASEAAPAEQTTCPVLPGQPIDPNIYTEYQGKRVYFCCNDCKTKFLADPRKYLAKLPQFAGAAGAQDKDEEHEHGGGATRVIAQLIEPMGITTLSLAALTVTLGVLRRKNPRAILPWHKRSGVATLIAGATHATLVMIVH